MKTNYLNINRYEIINNLIGEKNIGVELGVAEGSFSYQMMESKKFKYFYGIDSYDMFQHDNNEYIKAKKKLSNFENYKLIRKKFNDSLDDFQDNSLDFIYIDGFAHEGSDAGKALIQWIKKLKIGGICAGDDYHRKWPLVKMIVDDVVSQLNLELNITNKKINEKYSEFPSWFFVKKEEKNITLSKNYEQIARINKKKRII
mgnify:FL=1